MQHHHLDSVPPADSFPTDPTGLPEASWPELLELADSDTLELSVGPVAKPLGDATVRMLGYNGSIPGSTVKVAQGSEIVVHVENHGDLDTTVHWHGLRLENRYDGVPHETQAPIPVGGEFSYRIQFPDPGLYWYHPHIREDYTQELGLYGNILVVPAEPDYWPPADRDLILTLDDILIEDGKVAPFSPTETTFAAMGRFGNRLLVAGDPDLRLTFRAGEVVRLWLTNTANTRVFNLTLPGAQMKLVGGDSGRVEHEEVVEQVVLAPSERVVVDVLVESPGELALEHHTPNRTYRLAAISVTEGAPSAAATRFGQLHRAPELEAERAQLDRWLAAAPDKILALVAQMDDPAAMPEAAGPVTYACPMHPDVTSAEPGRCPKCGMKLLASQVPTVTTYACPMHPEVVSDQPGHCPKCGMKLLAAGSTRTTTADHDHARIGQSGMDHAGIDHSGMEHRGTVYSGMGHGGAEGIEWEDDMVEVNRQTTSATMHWRFLDRTTGADNPAIDWRFTVGDRVKIRLINEMASDHPMHHPFHLHGAGRFLVLARDGVTEPNLVWKDTVLVRTGETVDIMFDVTNPGLWMAHCHIAEHMQSGMMFSFNVARR
ncbi:MAG TPA: multicopper oxidase domain-containing protein [Propionibacteriaceae bacterium]|nr:multicopper oxidase domain-containing protein [Propionibacteriaceae bacterium]